ncbi:MAG: hypothetical protein AB8B91_22015 [Rubripirellula sp.]
MSSSPFEIFRRNLKPLMVVLTILALFSFVVLPALDGYLRRGGGMNTDPVAAEFDGVEVKRSRVALTTQHHASIVGFLGNLARETMNRGGEPQTPGFQIDQQSGQIQAIGIDANPSEQATVNTLRFYSEAKKAGFELDDTAIRTWLARFTDGTMTDGEVIGMLMQSTNNQLGQQHLYEQLRMHLLADLYQRGSLVGLTNGQIPVVTPLGQWQNFLKMNQSATVDAYGVLVSEYMDEANIDPSESEIKKIYEEGKDRLKYPDDDSPTPKFKRPDSAKLEFVGADLSKFLEAEKAKISEEQLRAEYERRLAGGDFQLPADSPEAAATDKATPDADASEAGSEENETTADKPAAEESSMRELSNGVQLVVFQDEGKPAAPEAPKTPEVPSPTEPAAKPAEVKPDATPEKPATEKPAVETAKTEPQSKPTKEAPKAEKPAEPSKPSEPAGDAKSVAEESPAMDTKPATETPEVEDKPAAKKEVVKEPAADAPTTEESAKQEAMTETKPAAEKPAAEKSADKEKPSPAKPSTSGDEMDLGDEPEPTKPQSFDDVRDQIATEMANNAAREALDQAVTQANKRMRRYFTERAVHESNVSVGVQTEEEAPKPLDLKAMAEELGLDYGQTELVNRVSVEESAPGSSFGLGASFNRRGPPMSAMLFGAQMQDGSSLPAKAVYSPLRSVDLEAGVTYITWKTEDVPAYVPELDEVRDEIVDVLRLREAQKLAKADAEKIAASADGKSLAEVVPEDKKANLTEGAGPFSWLNQVGFMQTSIGNVPELDRVGEEFMRAAFTTEVGSYAVASNDPESVYYVLKPSELQPEVDQLREQFRQPQQRFMAQLLGNDDARDIIRGFYESVDERTGFEMKLDTE